jgi:hypothetical protein
MYQIIYATGHIYMAVETSAECCDQDACRIRPTDCNLALWKIEIA